MFAISLILVVLVSSAFLLYQYWSGALAPREHDAPLPDTGSDQRDEAMSPARAA